MRPYRYPKRPLVGRMGSSRNYRDKQLRAVSIYCKPNLSTRVLQNDPTDVRREIDLMPCDLFDSVARSQSGGFRGASRSNAGYFHAIEIAYQRRCAKQHRRQ